MNRILYGGDYNPEQWPETVWADDLDLMVRASVNTVSVPVFGWVSLQPDEDTYTFEWLDRVLDGLASRGISACLATATASQPAWLDQKYPATLMVDEDGTRRRHGGRHSFCPSAPDYRRLADALIRRLAERYKSHPALALWHINNEFGNSGLCWCDRCAAQFRLWLTDRYGNLDTLNERWCTRFWGHTFTDWAQIEPPYRNAERNIQALAIDWKRFQTSRIVDVCRAEASILRAVTPGVPVTTNLMGAFWPLDYRRLAAEVDVVSWDNYPAQGAPFWEVAFAHALMRGLKDGAPFLLLEQSPSQQNWQPYNTLKAPGELRLQSFQAIAHGADSVMYFQWRRSRGGIEKLHGAIVEHHGRADTRVFGEVAALGAELSTLGDATIGGRTPARVGLLFDWESWWSLSVSSGPSRDLDYGRVVRRFFGALHRLGILVDFVFPDSDLGAYDLLLAPLLTMVTDAAAQRLIARVDAGATLLATSFTGLVDDTDRVHPGGPPGPLRDLLGLWVEETDAVLPGETQGILLADGTRVAAGLLCDRLRLDNGTHVLGTYTDDFYAGEPAFTCHGYGYGGAYYLATFPDDAGLETILGKLCADLGIVPPLGAAPPSGVETTVRANAAGELIYVLNHNAAPVDVPLPAGSFVDLLTGETLSGAATLPARGVRVLRRG